MTRESFRSYDTPRSVAAFVEAEHDRRKYWRGEAAEMHIGEPDTVGDTRPVLLTGREYVWVRVQRSEIYGL